MPLFRGVRGNGVEPQAYLCDEDRASGENYDHRKQCLVSQLRILCYVYAIDLCAYGVMSNHYHVVLHLDQPRAAGWSKGIGVGRQVYRRAA